jgi:hypothetical protein
MEYSEKYFVVAPFRVRRNDTQADPSISLFDKDFTCGEPVEPLRTGACGYPKSSPR